MGFQKWHDRAGDDKGGGRDFTTVLMFLCACILCGHGGGAETVCCYDGLTSSIHGIIFVPINMVLLTLRRVHSNFLFVFVTVGSIVRTLLLQHIPNRWTSFTKIMQFPEHVFVAVGIVSDFMRWKVFRTNIDLRVFI